MSFPCKFTLGQQVVCIDAGDGGTGGPWLGDAPKEGAVYTIRAMCPTNQTRDGFTVIYLYFKEIRRSSALLPWPPYELGYYHTRFRALERAQGAQKTDITIFRKILEEINERAREKA